MRFQEAIHGYAPGVDAVQIMAYGELKTGWVGIGLLVVLLVLRLSILMQRRKR